MTNHTTQFTKRARYEIFRRDKFTCRYCGAKAPDVQLQVDHVMPVALGGETTPDNAVTACADCNSGKSATPADAPIVEDVREHDLKFRKAVRDSLLRFVEEETANEDEVDSWAEKFVDYWCDNLTVMDKTPARMLESFDRWYSLGVPDELIFYAMKQTGAYSRGQAWSVDRKWRYTCSIIWNRIEQAGEEAAHA